MAASNGRKKKTGGRGRRRIDIERIANEEARHVCFSKRRAGLFSKASDLATLCGAELVLVVYSPSGNPYSFGSPGVRQVADRLLLGNAAGGGARRAQQGSVVQQLNAQCTLIADQLKAECAKRPAMEEQVDELVRQNQAFRFVRDVEGLGLFELERLKESMEFLRMRIKGRMEELMMSGGGGGGGAAVPNVAAMAGANPIGDAAAAVGVGVGQGQLGRNLGYGPAGADQARLAGAATFGYGRRFY